MKEPFEIKVYEIDDVEHLQRRKEGIAEVRRLSQSVWHVHAGQYTNVACVNHMLTVMVQKHFLFPVSYC